MDKNAELRQLQMTALSSREENQAMLAGIIASTDDAITSKTRHRTDNDPAINTLWSFFKRIFHISYSSGYVVG